MWSFFFRYRSDGHLSLQARLVMIRLLYGFGVELWSFALQDRVKVLAKQISMSPGLVGKCINELLQLGLLESELVLRPTKRGRPARKLGLSVKLKNFLKQQETTKILGSDFLESLGLHDPQPNQQKGLKLSRGQAFTLAVLVAHANDLGLVARLTKSEIAALTGLKVPSLTACLRHLEKAYILGLASGFNSRTSLGRQSSVYLLNLQVFGTASKSLYEAKIGQIEGDKIAPSAQYRIGLGLLFKNEKGESERKRILENDNLRLMYFHHVTNLASQILSHHSAELDAILSEAQDEGLLTPMAPNKRLSPAPVSFQLKVGRLVDLIREDLLRAFPRNPNLVKSPHNASQGNLLANLGLGNASSSVWLIVSMIVEAILFANWIRQEQTRPNGVLGSLPASEKTEKLVIFPTAEDLVFRFKKTAISAHSLSESF